jgi:hypothetical protein
MVGGPIFSFPKMNHRGMRALRLEAISWLSCAALALPDLLREGDLGTLACRFPLARIIKTLPKGAEVPAIVFDGTLFEHGTLPADLVPSPRT